MGMTTHSATHYRVVCSLCAADSYRCPERHTEVDVRFRVVKAFERAGWFQDADGSVPSHDSRRRGSPRDYGEGTWYCAACRRRGIR